MALSDRDIVITPNKGQTDDPKIVFSGANANVSAQTITLRVYPDNAGTLSFEGSAGQLFAITNDLTGTLFSVNDGSGIPSLEVNADGTVTIAEFGGNVGIGTGTPVTDLHVQGETVITGRVGIGTSNVVTLNSNIFSVYGTAMVHGNLRMITPTGGTAGVYFSDGTYQTTAFTGAGTPSFGTAGTIQVAGAGNAFSGDSGTFVFDVTNDRLGIGTSTPTNSLSVFSTATPAWFNTVNSAIGSNNFEILIGNGTSTGTTVGYVNNPTVPYGYISAGSTSRNIIIASNGRTGIGGTTAPQNTLDVNGNVVIGAVYSGVRNAPANGLLVQGSVGIGTFTPLSTLDVRGGVGVTAASNFGDAVSVASIASNGAISGTTITGTAGTFTSIQNSGLERAANIVSNTWIHATQNLTVASSNTSTSTTTGAAVITGGVGIGGNINAGGNTHVLSGSLGLRHNPNLWSNAQSTAIQIKTLNSTGATVSLAAQGVDDELALSRNVYYDGGDWRHAMNDSASMYGQDIIGNHVWRHAPADIAGNVAVFQDIMLLGNDGTLITSSMISGGGVFTAAVGIGTADGTGVVNAAAVFGTVNTYGNIRLITPTGGTAGVYFADGTYQTTANGPGFTLRNSNYTAVNGDKLLCDTSGGSFTVTLPASPTFGSTVLIYDRDNFTTNPLNIARNGATIEGIADDFILDIGQTKNEIVYDGSTWHIYVSIGPRGLSGSNAATTTSIAYSIALG